MTVSLSEPETAARRGLAETRSGSAPAGLRFAVLGPPAIQLVRFLTKIALAWFVLPGEFGEALLAGLVLYGVAHAAALGLDEAWIFTREWSRACWRRLRRLHQLAGASCALVTAALALALRGAHGYPELSGLLLALAPMAWSANLSVLPMAALTRQRAYRDLFRLELAGVSSYAAVLLVAAALGAGPWSYVLGLHANALVMALLGRRLAAAHLPPDRVDDLGDAGGADRGASTVRYGAHLCGATVLGFFVEKLDSLAIAAFLGRVALGLYELALHASSVALNYATGLSERVLFPTLAAQRRSDEDLGRSYLEVLRSTVVFLVPLHMVLALVAAPLADILFPGSYGGAAILLSLLAPAAGARCLEVVCITALKAHGASAQVLRLGLVRLALLLGGLAIALPRGLSAVAWAVLATRVAAAAAALVLAQRALRPRAPAGRSLARAFAFLGAFVASLGAGVLGVHSLALGAPPALVLDLALAALLWLLARSLVDGRALREERRSLRARWSAAAQDRARRTASSTSSTSASDR